MHIVLDSLARDLFRRREERPDVDIETQIRECRRNHLLAAVVAILTDLGDQDARAAPVIALEVLDEPLHLAESTGHRTRLRSIDARYSANLGAMAAEDHFQRIGNLADRRFRTRGLDREIEQVGAALSALGQRVEGR